MTAEGMANQIIQETDQCNDPFQANSKFYKGVCDYVEANAQVFYSWTAFLTSTPFSPDPQVIIEAKIKTSGTLTPSGATDCSSALSIFSSNLNANASTWTIIWPAGFSLSPAFVIPTINITPSSATNRDDAIVHLCREIIAGLKLATPAAGGTHGPYAGNASFTQLI